MKTDCKPLMLTNLISERFPDCWNILDEMKKDYTFDEKCYLPIGVSIAALEDAIGDKIETIILGEMVSATAAWRIHKQIYQFTPEMEEMLTKQLGNEDTVVPVEAFYNLPYKCIYIKLTQDEDFDGFFVHFDYCINQKRLELRLSFVGHEMENRWVSSFIYLEKGKTLKDVINEIYAETYDKLNKYNKKIGCSKDEYMQDYLGMVEPYLQLVLYICSENKEVEENPKQKQITRKPKNKQLIKDKYREVQIWDCGLQTTEIIRNYRKTKNYTDSTKQPIDSVVSKAGTPKRPHSRRGHWHHYWTGALGTEQRKLVLRWVVPTFIHAGTNAVQVNIVNE